MSRAVVFGAGGLLGGYLVDELRRAEHEVVALDRGSCSITDERAVAAAVAGVAWVFNPAAWTDVDGCERDPDRAFAHNALGAENVARATHQAGGVVLHVSTDFVFGAAHLDRPYDEFDPPDPLSVYARSKRAGELLVERAAPRHHVVRVQGLYGHGGRNFSSKLRALLLAGKTGLRLDDQRRVQPTFARAAARALVAIARSDRYGTWHASCRGAATWHRFTLAMAERLGLKQTWEAVPSSALTLPAARPPNCLLDNRRLALYGLPPLPSWEVALNEYLREISNLEVPTNNASMAHDKERR